MKKYLFPTVIAMSALAVSSAAAFYSVSGLMKLFAGAALAVGLMSASLEVAKLVIASLLYQYRKTLPFLLKAYLSIACVVLILITSMGIYGFLSAAYQDTANKEGNIDARITLIETKRDNVKEQLEVYTEEKSSINGAISELRKGLSNNKVQWKDKETGQIITSTSSSTRKALTKQLDQAIERQTEVNTKVDSLNTVIFGYETEIVETRIEEGSTSELGPLKYLSGLTGLPMDKIINYLLLTIIFVFDPLAIALVIAANFAFARLKKPTKENLYGETVEIEEPEPIEEPTEEPIEESIEDPIEEPVQIDEDWEEAEERINIIGQNGNDGLHYEEEEKLEEPKLSPNSTKISDLEKEIEKINSQDTTGKKSSIAISNLKSQIQKLRDEDNIITY